MRVNHPTKTSPVPLWARHLSILMGRPVLQGAHTPNAETWLSGLALGLFSFSKLPTPVSSTHPSDFSISSERQEKDRPREATQGDVRVCACVRACLRQQRANGRMLF